MTEAFVKTLEPHRWEVSTNEETVLITRFIPDDTLVCSSCSQWIHFKGYLVHVFCKHIKALFFYSLQGGE